VQQPSSHPEVALPFGTMMSFKEIEPYFAAERGRDAELSVKLREDGSLSIYFAAPPWIKQGLAISLPAPANLKALGLVVRAFHENQPAYSIFMFDTGLEFMLTNRDIEGDLEEVREARASRGYHPAFDRAVEMLETASQPMSNHRKIEIYEQKLFRVISD
jgi:hypothetical protein